MINKDKSLSFIKQKLKMCLISVLNSYHDFADTHFDMVKCNFKIKYIEK